MSRLEVSGSCSSTLHGFSKNKLRSDKRVLAVYDGGISSEQTFQLFSDHLQSYMIENLTIKKGSGDKFLQYPRFIQLIINVQAPGLEKLNVNDVLVLEHMKDKTLNRLRTYRDRPSAPPTKRLFKHVINVNYREPGKSKWRNDGSDSDREDIFYQMTESDVEETQQSTTRAAKEEEADAYINLEGGDDEGSDEDAAALIRKKKGKEPVGQSSSGVHFAGEVRAEEQQAVILEGQAPAAKRIKRKVKKYQSLFVEAERIPQPAPIQSVQQQQQQQQQQQPPQPPEQQPQPPLAQPSQFAIPPNVAQELSDLNRVMLKLMMFKFEQEELNRQKDARMAQLEAENRQLNLTVVELGSTVKALQKSNTKLIESNKSLSAEVVDMKEKQLRLGGPPNVDQDTDETDDEADEGNNE